MPTNDKLGQLQAIAQIYGALSGPQFQARELDLRQQQQQQYMALQQMQLQQQSQYQSGELANDAARVNLGQQAQALQSKDFDEKLAQGKVLADQRNQERSDAVDARTYDALSRDPTLSTARRHALSLASQDTGPGTFIQKFSHYGDQADQTDAQNAWNTVAPAWGKMTPDARTATFSGLMAKYPGMASGQIDFSKGFPSTVTSTIPATLQPPQTLFGSAGAKIRNAFTNLYQDNGSLGDSISNHTILPLLNMARTTFGYPELPDYNPAPLISPTTWNPNLYPGYHLKGQPTTN